MDNILIKLLTQSNGPELASLALLGAGLVGLFENTGIALAAPAQRPCGGPTLQ